MLFSMLFLHATLNSGCDRSPEPPSPAPTATEQMTRELLVGTWHSRTSEMQLVYTFAADGTVSSRGWAIDRHTRQRLDLDVACTWSFDGNVLSFRTVSTNLPQLYPIGGLNREKVTRISNDEMLWVDEAGDNERLVRGR